MSSRSERPDCRPHCGACCIAPSISSAMPSAPAGKAADQACPHLTVERRCALFGDPRRPAVCVSLQPSVEMCGDSREHALGFLSRLERMTAPVAARP